MRIPLSFGSHSFEVEVPTDRLLGHFRGPDGVQNPGERVSEALSSPLNYPPLRASLVPDDAVTVVVDDRISRPALLLLPVLEHIHSAGVEIDNITVLTNSAARIAADILALPEPYNRVAVEQHDPTDRQKLALLATTESGLRLYLNRSLVDAGQSVVLTGRHYDPILGYGGAEGAIFPALADEACKTERSVRVPVDPPGEKPWPTRRDAIEATWLLGQPFFVQAIPASEDGIAQVVAGAVDACREGERLLDQSWRKSIPRRVETVLLRLSLDPRDITFARLATAVHMASRLVQPKGRLVVLCPGVPEPEEGCEILLRASEPEPILATLEKGRKANQVSALLWARAVTHAHVFLWSELPTGTVEDLFATEISQISEVQRLINQGGELLILEDAQDLLIEVE